MTVDASVQGSVATPAQQSQASDKDVNLANLRKQTEEARLFAQQARMENERLQRELESIKKQPTKAIEEDEDDGSEPYIDKKTLKRELNRFKANMDQEVESRVNKRLEEANARDFLYRLKAEYKDFDEVLTAETASKLEQSDPEFAREILSERDEYRKRKLAYHAIKAAGLHKRAEPPREMSAQEKIAANQRNPYYTPNVSGHGTNSGAVSGSRYSEDQKKSAFEKMRELQRGSATVRA